MPLWVKKIVTSNNRNTIATHFYTFKIINTFLSNESVLYKFNK